MEEILASIKRVIREDGRAPGQPRVSRRRPAEPEPAAPAAGDEDVLELTEPMGGGTSGENGLLSDNAASASRQSLAALSAVREREVMADGGPLEAVVRDMLRPILKQWLDDNLPQIVEELVTREIARITGRKL